MGIPQVDIVVAIVRDTSNVAVKRTSDRMWRLPYGHLEMDETFESCAIRIAKENGFDVRQVQIVNTEVHSVTICLVADLIEDDSPAAREQQWFYVYGLPKPLAGVSDETITKLREIVADRFSTKQRDNLEAAVNWVRQNGQFDKGTIVSSTGNYAVVVTVEEYGTETKFQVAEKLKSLGATEHKRSSGVTYQLPRPHSDYFVIIEESVMYEGCTT